MSSDCVHGLMNWVAKIATVDSETSPIYAQLGEYSNSEDCGDLKQRTGINPSLVPYIQLNRCFGPLKPS
jgi:hypothetical protein